MADGGTFPIETLAERVLRLRPRIVPALVVLVLVLALAFLGSLYWRGAATAEDLSNRIEIAQTQAAAVERLERQLDAANRQVVFLTGQKRKPETVATLAAVAQILPTDAWIYEFEKSGDEIRLHGFSASAASLIALFDASPLFRDAQFRSPLMQAQNNLQRFDMSFKLGSAGP